MCVSTFVKLPLAYKIKHKTTKPMAVQTFSENQNSFKSFSFKQKLVFGTWRLADKDSAEPKDILERIKKCIELGMMNFDLAGSFLVELVKIMVGNTRKIHLSRSNLSRF